MIRFLQKDSRVVKAFFVVIIAAASVGMVVYLIPGLMGLGSTSTSAYAVVYSHWWNRIFSSGATVTLSHVEDVARTQLEERSPQYAQNPMILRFYEQQIGRQLVQEQVLLVEAHRLGIRATDEDVLHYLQSGANGEVLYPNGKFIGQDAYAQLISERLHESVRDFEQSIKDQIAITRLQSLVTAGVTVSDQEVRDSYRKQNIKVKFDYAVISAEDLRKTINPADSDLEAFFKKNAARYAEAVPEQRQIAYVAFSPSEVPGGVQQPTQQEIQQYYQEHQSDYQVPEQARARHILIKVAENADAKTDAAAKAKAESILKQLQSGGSWTELAKKNSDDPGTKNAGGEMGFVNRNANLVSEYLNALFAQKVGDIDLVRSKQYGYFIIQVEERQPAHLEALNEVLPTIQATLVRQKSALAQQNYAQQLTSEAVKDGLQKTAAAHHLQLVTTQPVAQDGVIPGIADSTQVLKLAFAAKQGGSPQSAATGEGYAVFQVTGVVAAHAPTFADWKSHVLDDFRSEQLPALLNQKTKELADKAKELKDLAKAAKLEGATVKTSDLLGQTGQAPDLGQLGQVAPQLFDLNPGDFSSPIVTQRTGVVVKILDKQVPTADEIAKNFDQTRDTMLEEQRSESFNLFANGVWNDFLKRKMIQMNTKALESQDNSM
jgi:peptidyl-prolyl cis-trans isomerase D